MKLFRCLSILLFQGFLFMVVGLIGCSSTSTDQEIIEQYRARCFAEDSPYRKTIEKAYRNSGLGSRFKGLDLYTGPDSTDEQRAQYIQSLKSTEQMTCAYLAKIYSAQPCAEIAYVNDEQEVSYEERICTK